MHENDWDRIVAAKNRQREANANLAFNEKLNILERMRLRSAELRGHELKLAPNTAAASPSHTPHGSNVVNTASKNLLFVAGFKSPYMNVESNTWSMTSVHSVPKDETSSKSTNEAR